MKEITSKDNRIVKLCRQLETRKFRDKLGAYLIEGENLLAEALAEEAPLEAVLVRKGSAQQTLTQIEARGSTAERTYCLEEKLFDQLAQTDTSQGMLAIVRKPQYTAAEAAKLAKGRNFVVLDRLQDPGNIGTIIRTAEAAGYGMVVCLKGTADVYAPKVVRAAAGALFRVPVVLLDDVQALQAFTRAAGGKLVATCFDTDRYYFQEDLTKNIALIIGNEGNGISAELLESADLKIKIPMCGRLESLNASVAAAILMYEAVRGSAGGQRYAAG